MKPPTVFLGEMTNLEVEEFLSAVRMAVGGPAGGSGVRSRFFLDARRLGKIKI